MGREAKKSILFSSLSDPQPEFTHYRQPEELGLQQEGFKLDKQRPTNLIISAGFMG